MAAPQLEWIRPPHQARSRATLDRLLDAAEARLAEKTWEEIGVAEIAARANSSVGAFYARFRDKDALLNALHERFVAEARATGEEHVDPERWRGASVSKLIEAIIQFRVRIYSERAGLLRALVPRTVYDPVFRVRSQKLQRDLNKGFEALLVARRRELLHPEPAIAAEFVGWMMHSVLQHRLLFHEGANGASRVWTVDQVATELTHACLAYLGVFPESALDM